MYCAHCGEKLSVIDKFCPKCGQKVEKLSPLMKGAQILLYIISGLGVIETMVASLQMKSFGLFAIMTLCVGIGFVLPTFMSTRLEHDGRIKDAKILILTTFIGFGFIIALVNLLSSASNMIPAQKGRISYYCSKCGYSQSIKFGKCPKCGTFLMSS
jgi:hypothetical protein